MLYNDTHSFQSTNMYLTDYAKYVCVLEVA